MDEGWGKVFGIDQAVADFTTNISGLSLVRLVKVL